MKPGPRKGYKQSSSHVKAKSTAQTGEGNGMYKDGRRSYRRIAGAEDNDGKVVSHVNHDRSDNRKSNLKVLNDPPKKGTKKAGRTTTSQHEKYHAKTKPRK